jgi:hypothetical protein
MVIGAEGVALRIGEGDWGLVIGVERRTEK